MISLTSATGKPPRSCKSLSGFSGRHSAMLFGVTNQNNPRLDAFGRIEYPKHIARAEHVRFVHQYGHPAHDS